MMPHAHSSTHQGKICKSQRVGEWLLEILVLLGEISRKDGASKTFTCLCCSLADCCGCCNYLLTIIPKHEKVQVNIFDATMGNFGNLLAIKAIMRRFLPTCWEIHIFPSQPVVSRWLWTNLQPFNVSKMADKLTLCD